MHRARLSLLPCLTTLVFVSTASALPSTPPEDERQTFEARFIDPTVGSGIKERKGQLVVDAAARVIRFERDERMLFTVGGDDIVATHYESTAREGQRRAEGRHYIALFWSSPSGPGATAIRIEAADVDQILGLIEITAGLPVPRSSAQRSFLGIPVRASVGDFVEVTDTSGVRVRGRLTRVATTSIALADASSAVHDFDQAVVLKVEHAFERSGRTAGRAFGTGLLVGVGIGLGALAILSGGSGFGDALSDPKALVGLLGGAATYAALWAGIDALGPGKPLRNRLIYSR